MELSATTQFGLSLGTILAVGAFVFKLSRDLSKFKENITLRIEGVEDRMNEHDKQDKENNMSERLARIEVDIQWIRQALNKKK